MDGALDLDSLFEMAADEARRLGYTGTLRIDDGALSVGDLGPMVIPAPVLERLEGKTIAQQRSIMAGVVSRFLRSHAPALDGRYDKLQDSEVRARLQRNLFALESEPERPRPWNAVGRIERALAVDGWEQRLRRAAELYATQANRRHAEGHEAATSDIDAANMYRLAGMATASRQAAETALARLDPGSPLFEPRDRCAALALAGRRGVVAAYAAEVGWESLGPRWWPFGVAAAAAERGDRESLRRELEAVARRAAIEEIDLDATSLGDRDMAEVMGEWLRELE